MKRIKSQPPTPDELLNAVGGEAAAWLMMVARVARLHQETADLLATQPARDPDVGKSDQERVNEILTDVTWNLLSAAGNATVAHARRKADGA